MVVAPAAAETVKPPNDPLFRHQWNLPAIQIPAAWEISRGAGAVVAVLDTGIAYEDRGRYRRAPDFAGTRFVRGWDFVDDDAHPNDAAAGRGLRSHGTQMAAIVAQTAGNGLGAAGVAPAAALMPIRVLEPDLAGSVRAVARGLRYAADHGAHVANLSFSGTLESPEVAAAVRYATAKGVTVVGAAGNDGSPYVSWPAAYPSAIAVGALGRNLRRAPYSNHGAALDLTAPAGTGPGDAGHGPVDGIVAQTLLGGPSQFCFCFTASTSAAAAQVSGVAALLIGSKRARGPAAVRAALLRGARDLGPKGRDREYGAGLVQALGALRVAAGEPPVAGGADRGSSAVPALSLGVAVLAAGFVLVLVRRRRRPGRAG